MYDFLVVSSVQEEFGDDVQVKPQKLRVELRARMSCVCVHVQCIKHTHTQHQYLCVRVGMHIYVHYLLLYLHSGQPKEFTLQFKPSENFPLDLYFFLDATGSFSRRFRDTVPELATDLGINDLHIFFKRCQRISRLSW